MKVRIRFIIAISLLALNSYVEAACGNSTKISGKQSRAEASEAAYQAKIAAEDAMAAADLALRITTREDFTSFSKSLKGAATKARRAAKRAETKADYAYNKSLAANKSFVDMLVRDSRAATVKTEVALKEIETFLRRGYKSGEAEINSMERDLKRLFQESAESAKKAANTASVYAETRLDWATSDLSPLLESAKELYAEQKRKVEDAYDHDLSQLENQIATSEEQQKLDHEQHYDLDGVTQSDGRILIPSYLAVKK